MSKAIKQLSIFVENKKGELSDITTLLASKHISIESINLSDASDFGILRLIVNDSQRAKDILEKNGFSSKFTDVFAVEISDHVGSFNSVIKALAKQNINIEYTYTLTNAQIGAFVFKVADPELESAIKSLEREGIHLLSEI
ncbi:amino acid-binding protein [Sulfurimonas hongkongensis]|uniref:Amino acid-binding protein n=1 Tax=Sulfurimonas hongkongensis TaxID=1172190 RepID=T0KU09_9BACT|nr:ACT domain-containing protein [Sulfurimonas hongkongensis]EQB40484.1 amino acid-binding protein [Sulfurimonas hongkongensis]